MVDYVLDIAKEKGLEDIYAIMLPENSRALRLMKKMGCNFEYLGDGTVRGTLILKNEDSETRCNMQPEVSRKNEGGHSASMQEPTNEDKPSRQSTVSP
jgi:hypothetical protein